jgi:DNA-binding MarR family transcriptional regulator
VDGGMKERAMHYFRELESLTKDNENKNQKITGRYLLAKVLLNTLNMRPSTQLQGLRELSDLEQHEDLFVKLDSLITQAKLLLFEYSLTENDLAKRNILDAADDKLELVLDYIQHKSNITYELHAASIRMKIEFLRDHQESVVDLIEFLQEHEIRIYDEEISEISQELFHFPKVTQFEFLREFQSIPKIKILLYLLPRIKVTYSELQEGTNISSGNLSGQIEKLEKLGYISKDKVFLEERPITMLRISPEGYVELKRYIAGLTDFFSNFV